MRCLKQILYIADPGVYNLEALQRTVDLARRVHASLTVAALWSSPSRSVPRSLVPLVTQREAELMREELEAVVACFRCQGVEIVCEPLREHPLADLVSYIVQRAHDLVIVPYLEKGMPHEADYNRLIHGLTRECPTPVWVMKTVGPRGYGRVLAAVDPSIPERIALNHEILVWAHALGEIEHGDIHIVHTWVPPGATLMSSPRKASPQRLFNYVREVRTEHERLFDEFLLTHGEPEGEYRLHFERGSATDVIPRLARELRIGVVITGITTPMGVVRLLTEKTAEHLLSRVHTSLLLVNTLSRVANYEAA